MHNGNGKGKAVSPAKLAANRRNALKSTGPRTPEGKATVSVNALKHGLLAREAVILHGDGKEDPGEFAALLKALTTSAAPEGPMEEILVERIALCYWRLRRACRCEVGMLREGLDSYRANFYGPDDLGVRHHYTEYELPQRIKDHRERVRQLEADYAALTSMMKQGKPLEETYQWDKHWEGLYDIVRDKLTEAELKPIPSLLTPSGLHRALASALGWSDQDIFKVLHAACGRRLVEEHKALQRCQRETLTNPLAVEVARLKRSLPESHDMDRLLRYETAIERQLYRALAQLERLQRQRRGERLPPPLQVEVTSEK